MSDREKDEPTSIQALLAAQPTSVQANTDKDDAVVQESIHYLSSEDALRSLDGDPYWPKWNSPWWHMSVLYEMGRADRIPEIALQAMVAALKRQYVPYFFASDVPAGRDPVRDTFCHCGLGNVFQFMSAAGVDMDETLPWARSWFLRYQMPDGGFNCDEAGYHAQPPASSMVGTIAPLEAVLFFTKRPFTPDEEKFLDAGATCLVARKLMLGSSAPFNTEETMDEADWLNPCFPRFYLYDTLRGLNFILRWSEKRRKTLPIAAVTEVIAALCEAFPDGQIRVGRHAFEGVGSKVQDASGRWTYGPTASFFPLLNQVSELGQVSPYLTAQWGDAKGRIQTLIREGLLT